MWDSGSTLQKARNLWSTAVINSCCCTDSLCTSKRAEMSRAVISTITKPTPRTTRGETRHGTVHPLADVSSRATVGGASATISALAGATIGAGGGERVSAGTKCLGVKTGAGMRRFIGHAF